MWTAQLSFTLFLHLLCLTEQNPTGSALEPSPAILYFDDGEKAGRAFPVCLAIAGSWAFPDLHFLLHPDEVRNFRSCFPVDLFPIPVKHCISGLSALPDGELTRGRGHDQICILHEYLHALLHKTPRAVSCKTSRAGSL